MTKHKKHDKVIALGGQLAQKLIEFCYNEGIPNPKISIDAHTTDGEHYRLVFERLDIDKLIFENEIERSSVKLSEAALGEAQRIDS